MNKKFLIIIIFLISFGCFTVNPLLAQSETIDPSATTFDWFWFLYEYEEGPGFNARVFRPLFMRHTTEDSIFDASLMPVFFWRYRTARGNQWSWFLGFGGDVDYIHDNGDHDFDFGFFPLLFFGSGQNREDNYFFLYPFGGSLGEKFGTDRINAYIFPGFLLFVFFPPAQLFSWTTILYIVASMVPAYASYDRGDYHGYSFFWPIFHRGRSPLLDEFRILPFYAHMHKTGWYDKYSVLMLFNYQRIYFRNDELKVFFFFPFFGRKWSRSGRISSTTILWPFFSWGYDRKTNDRQYNLPWPLVMIRDREKPFLKMRIFFPFYGSYETETNETLFVTPLYFRLRRRSTLYDSENLFVGLIAMRFTRQFHGEGHPRHGRWWRYFKLWPLYHVEENERGEFSFSLLSLLPFRDPDGYERLYQPLWSLLEYRRLQNGEQRLGLFMRLYFQRWGDNFFQFRIPFVISYRTRENRLTEFTILLSMFGYNHNRDGRYVRLFWVPVRIGDADEVIAGSEPEPENEENDFAHDAQWPMTEEDNYYSNRFRYSYQFF